jgi:uncharacterized protein YlxW (UPF0749 family)
MTDKKQEQAHGPATGNDREIAGLQTHIRELKELVGKLETKIEKYEKRDNDSQSGNVCPADHR